MQATLDRPAARGNAIVDLWRRYGTDHPNFISLATTAMLLVGLIVLFYLINERFLSWRNIVIVLNQGAPYAILGVGMTFVITTKGIDLSIGAIVALSGTVMGLTLVSWELPLILALVAGLAAGAACGAFNGFCIARFRVPPLIVTLGTMALFRGISYVVLGHQISSAFPRNSCGWPAPASSASRPRSTSRLPSPSGAGSSSTRRGRGRTSSPSAATRKRPGSPASTLTG